MCGIFGYIGTKKNAGEIVLDGLKTLEYRGYDSWGVARTIEGGTTEIEKHVGKIGDATLTPKSASMAIGHTRWATHGNVTQKNAHPLTDCTGEVIIVHNGIIENYESLKNELLLKKHRFISETDSEVAAHLVEASLSTGMGPEAAILSVWKKLKGMNALIVFLPNYQKMYVLKNGSPIVFGGNKSGYFVASDSSAILPHTKNVSFLESNDLLIISKNGCELKRNGKKYNAKFVELDYHISSSELGKYPHFLLKEIHEQQAVITKIINDKTREISELAGLIKSSFGAYLIGCGTASYAGLAGSYLFSKIARRHINNAVASEFEYSLDFLKETSLVIALSQSGETIDTVTALESAHQKKAKLAAITNSLGSTIYRMSGYNFLLEAGSEKAVASTKAYTGKIATLFLTAHSINGSTSRGISELKKAVSEVKKILSNERAIKNLASKIAGAEHIFVLGRGISYAAALESALKIKEVSYIHAEGFAAGELKHGVIALVTKNSPIIVYNPLDETYADTLSSAHEVKARGGYIIGVSSKNNPVYDIFIQVNDCGAATIIPNVVIAQLLGYYLALQKGYDPDKPRNLAKSVTVK